MSSLHDELTRLDEGRLRLIEFALVEVRLRNDRPRNALLRRIDRRLPRQDRLRERDGARQILGRENFFRGARQHTRAVRMLREGLRELDARIGRALVQLRLGQRPAATPPPSGTTTSDA